LGRLKLKGEVEVANTVKQSEHSEAILKIKKRRKRNSTFSPRKNNIGARECGKSASLNFLNL